MAAVINDSLIHMVIEAPENVNHIERRNGIGKPCRISYVDEENGDLPLFTYRPMGCCVLPLVR